MVADRLSDTGSIEIQREGGPGLARHRSMVATRLLRPTPMRKGIRMRSGRVEARSDAFVQKKGERCSCFFVFTASTHVFRVLKIKNHFPCDFFGGKFLSATSLLVCVIKHLSNAYERKTVTRSCACVCTYICGVCVFMFVIFTLQYTGMGAEFRN